MAKGGFGDSSSIVRRTKPTRTGTARLFALPLLVAFGFACCSNTAGEVPGLPQLERARCLRRERARVQIAGAVQAAAPALPAAAVRAPARRQPEGALGSVVARARRVLPV
jgi:hypothetical protein